MRNPAELAWWENHDPLSRNLDPSMEWEVPTARAAFRWWIYAKKIIWTSRRAASRADDATVLVPCYLEITRGWFGEWSKYSFVWHNSWAQSTTLGQLDQLRLFHEAPSSAHAVTQRERFRHTIIWNHINVHSPSSPADPSAAKGFIFGIPSSSSSSPGAISLIISWGGCPNLNAEMNCCSFVSIGWKPRHM